MTPLGILGELRVDDDTVGGRRRRGLLALLLTRAGTTSSLERICDELWEGAPSEGAGGTVRTYLSQFRKLEAPLTVESDSSGYGVSVERNDLDATRFEDLVGEARTLTGEARLDHLDEALALWRGPALEEFRGSDWADRAALPLEETRRHVVADRLELLTEFGRFDEVLEGCAAQLADDPLDERLATLLAAVRYRTGRVSEALRGLSTTRRGLAEELGIDPGPEFVDLERRMLDRDPSLATLPTPSPAGGTPTTGRPALPEGTVTFLFTDIVGSTALNRRVGDEAYAGLLERHREIIVGAIDRAGGQIFGTEGDATFAVFAAADDACAGATGIVRGLRDEPWQGDNDVHVRVGLHSGRALVVHDDYTGATVHLAARVASTAHADQIVASDTTVSLAPEPEWHDLGVHRLKDIERPQRIWQLAAAGLPQDFPPLPTARNVPNNLPDPRDAFIGRDSELRDVRDSLADGPLTTLVGPGGVGKTRLASESARRALGDHPGGVHFVALAGVAGDEGVEAAVRRTMSLPDRTDLDLAGAVNSATAGEAALVILDNCEHLLDGASTVVRSLLDGCPQVRLLCTSREPLQVRSERVRWVEPLRSDTSDGISPAEELFLTRAEAATGRVTPDRELPLVRELVAALDGLPLAIELAAARTRGLALVDVVSRLDDRFRLLRSGDRAADERHQTLEGVIAWSHELLTPPDRLLLNRLAVFGQTFSLAAVEAVCTDEELDADDVFDGIGRLVDKSLAQLEVGETRSRYRLLETIRTFGLRRLEEAGRRREMEARLIDWVMQLVDRLEGNMRTERQDETIREATEERAVARTALHLLLAENRRHEALRIVASVPVDVPRERIRLIDELQPSTGGEPSEAAGRANLAAANLAVEMGAMSAGVRYAQAATRMYEDLGDPGNAAWGAFLEAFASWANDDIDGARDAIEDALDTFERLDDPIGLANASWMRASMGTDLDDAHQWSLEAERRCRAVDAPTALAHCLEVRALIALRRHEGDVGGWLAEAMDVFLALRHEGCTAHVLEAVAAATAATHADPGLVAELLGAADRLREISGHDHRPWELEGHEAAVGALASRLDQTEMDRSLERGREHTLDSAGAAARRLLDGIS